MTFDHNTKTKFSLILVGWVVLLCLAKNMGVSHAGCPMQVKGDHSAELELAEHSEVSEHCELSGKLLQQQFSQLEWVALFSFAIVLAIVAWLKALPNPTPHFTEPIGYPVRLHARHCVFRE
ncbi:hypothetical protein [Vibrio agarivorans]|uniref:hypothetical protein n=1 Tax=Vibrio agarivorans TaxID=153622 RepID=UPI0025B52ACE|nr:hypothetical protein [Vibrio agarivorans]MDN3660410.1 hypothetical protein [Vibrio agarivorans]